MAALIAVIVQYVGWIGAFFLAICGVPQAYKSIKEGHSRGVSWGLIVLWGLGDFLTLIYSLTLHSLPLTLNYLANAIFCYIIFHYKIRPRNKVDVKGPISYPY